MIQAARLCVLMFLLFTSCVQIPAAVERPAPPDELADQRDDLSPHTPDMFMADEEDLNDGRWPDQRPGLPQDMAMDAREDLWSGRPTDAKPGPTQDMSADQGADMRLNDGRGEL